MNDLRFALRQLARKPGFTAMVVLTLALGIGVTTAIFSVVNAALLRPLPYTNPEQLVRIYTEFPTFPNGGLRRFAFSPPELFDFRRDTKSWQSVNAYTTVGVNLTGDVEPVRVRGCMTTGSLLSELGVAPLAGRLIQASDDVPGAPRAAVLSYGLWQRVFGGNTNIIGKDIIAENEKAIVVGIMPKNFNFPLGEPAAVEVWGALRLDPASSNRGNHFLSVVGRLKPGVTLPQAQEEIKALVKRSTEMTAPNSHSFHDENHPIVSYGLHDEIVRQVRPALRMLFGAVCFVLLIACVNVGNLLLARAEHRQREIAIRSAIGAGFWRLIRQFIIEGIALSVFGALLGLFLAYHGLEFVKASSEQNLPRADEIGIDLNVCLFTAGLSILTGVLFGLTPIAHVLRGKEYLALKSAAASSTGTSNAHRFQQGLVVAEMALALMLLVGAGLMVRAFWLLQKVDTGFESDNVVTAMISMPRNNLSSTDNAKKWILLEERLRALPGVDAVGLSTGLPPIYDASFNDTEIEGYVGGPGKRPANVDYFQLVSSGYFNAMKMRLIEGRFFDQRDSLETPDVCVVNQTMAQAFWENKSAIGKRIRTDGDNPWCTIIGVIADAKNGGLDRPAGTEVYLPFNQKSAFDARSRFVSARSRGDLNVIAKNIRKEVQAVSAGTPVSRVRTLQEVVASARARPRFLTQLLGVFSTTALILASIGIYGVISYSVAQRTREFGVRMALGAQTSDVLRLVLSRGVLLTVSGLLIGLVGAVALTRFLSSLLFGVTPTDPVTFTLVPLVLATVALLASYFPARRATRVDPLKALRYE
ncbi:MAG TPA: ABC transporter permease [Verrucomicrobiae bacterium]|nr:ABC transporter permease [Verrucomicrobiae bacterium]